MHDLESIPTAVNYVRDSLEASSVESCIDDDLGRLIRGISATRHGGINLVSGSRASDLAGWIIDGMDMTCRLVVHHESEVDANVIKSAFNNDLRVTTHEQPFVDFLDDVESHRFAILVMAQPVLNVVPLNRAVQAVDDGGILMLLEADPESTKVVEQLTDFCLLYRSDRATVVVKRPQSNRPKRRGGRRRERD